MNTHDDFEITAYVACEEQHSGSDASGFRII